MSRRINWGNDGTICYAGHWPTTRYQMLAHYQTVFDDAETNYETGNYWQDAFGSGLRVWEYYYQIWNFPRPITLDEFRINLYSRGGDAADYITIYVSDNTTNGLDGSWTQVSQTNFSVTSNNVHYRCPLTPISTRWIRIAGTAGSANADYWENYRPRYMHWYGEYDDVLYTLYDNDPIEPGPITDWTDYLSLPVAVSDVDYFEKRQFKIKNEDVFAHSYFIQSESGIYGFNDSLVTNHYKVSTDGGVTPTRSLTTPNVQPGEFSPIIDVDFNLPKENNPINGVHYMRVRVKPQPQLTYFGGEAHATVDGTFSTFGIVQYQPTANATVIAPEIQVQRNPVYYPTANATVESTEVSLDNSIQYQVTTNATLQSSEALVTTVAQIDIVPTANATVEVLEIIVSNENLYEATINATVESTELSLDNAVYYSVVSNATVQTTEAAVSNENLYEAVSNATVQSSEILLEAV